MNLYAYAGNNPISFSDPFGLMGCKDPKDLLCRLAEMITAHAGGLQKLEPLMLAVISLPTLGVGEGAPVLWGMAGSGGEAAAVGPVATNAALRNTIRALFRSGDAIPGGTAGAIRNEALTGEATGGVFHLEKGIQRIANLERILRREPLNAADRATAQKLLADLRDAVKYAQEQAAK